MANKTAIQVLKFEVKELHSKESFVVVTKATNNDLNDRVFTVNGQLHTGDHLHLTPRSEWPWYSGPARYELRQGQQQLVMIDITETAPDVAAMIGEHIARQPLAPGQDKTVRKLRAVE